MPKSKVRRPPPRPENALTAATLALTRASLEIVREAELHITAAARAGEDTAAAVEVHHYLRTASLGLMVAYSRQAGLPDPRD